MLWVGDSLALSVNVWFWPTHSAGNSLSLIKSAYWMFYWQIMHIESNTIELYCTHVSSIILHIHILPCAIEIVLHAVEARTFYRFE